MEAVGVNAYGRTVVRVTVAEARGLLMQRLAMGKGAFARKLNRDNADVRKVVASLERDRPGDQVGV